MFILSLLRLLIPPAPYRAPAIPDGTAWCSDCHDWRATDVMPGIRSADVPPFTICTYCGAWLDVDSSVGAE